MRRTAPSMKNLQIRPCPCHNLSYDSRTHLIFHLFPSSSPPTVTHRCPGKNQQQPSPVGNSEHGGDEAQNESVETKTPAASGGQRSPAEGKIEGNRPRSSGGFREELCSVELRRRD
ncbi:unnamed protein product [Pleuronectes platessa]|uniref:Uncharacterized protein n=1 Tax=Pleuronectes platessa TaxID=8262 RepID=A0A9N7TK09_PLEPL|nr:unnamed protein product [Pleuronectes platessa]